MRALKAFVIVMAVLILAGVAIVIVTIVERSQRMAETGAESPLSSAPLGAPRGFDESRVKLPDGSRIVEMTAEGERLVLRLRLDGGGEQLVIIDMGTGQAIGTLVIERAP